MLWWEFLLWGSAGGAFSEILALGAEVRSKGDWPWAVKSVRASPILIMVVARIIISGVLALAIGQSGQLLTPVAAVAVGVSAPLIIARWSAPPEPGQGAIATGTGGPDPEDGGADK